MEEFVGGRNRISTSGFIRMRKTISCRGLIGIGTKDEIAWEFFSYVHDQCGNTFDRCRMTKVLSEWIFEGLKRQRFQPRCAPQSLSTRHCRWPVTVDLIIKYYMGSWIQVACFEHFVL